ncbi:hypothetical protein CJ179_13570 [Rhodococcus sp. ACS1]|nr:hypothetical protein CJ179_13570 [Rhodococcus sp. ACS1]
MELFTPQGRVGIAEGLLITPKGLPCVGLGASIQRDVPGQLSGAQARVAIAGALAGDVRLLPKGELTGS